MSFVVVCLQAFRFQCLFVCWYLHLCVAYIFVASKCTLHCMCVVFVSVVCCFICSSDALQFIFGGLFHIWLLLTLATFSHFFTVYLYIHIYTHTSIHALVYHLLLSLVDFCTVALFPRVVVSLHFINTYVHFCSLIQSAFSLILALTAIHTHIHMHKYVYISYFFL